MKKSGIISLILCFFILTGCLYLPVHGVENTDNSTTVDLSVSSGTHSIDASISVLGNQIITDNAKSVILYETNTDTLMYGYNQDEKVYPSSLVKILTALIAIEKGDLNQVVTIRKDVLDTVPIDAVSAELLPDELISLENLLYCMMVDSANDAAAVIADHISGSQEAFVEEMNLYASELGCTSTNFVNVHGLHHEEQYTTARDLCRILLTAIKNDTFYKIFSTVNYTVPATNLSEERVMTTGNFMMSKPDGMEIYFDDRVTGGRTGMTEDGGRCLAVCAESNGMQLISILMGAKSVYADDGYNTRIYGSFKETSAILDAGFNGFKIAQILFENQVLTQRPVINGENQVFLGTNASASTILPENITSSDLSYRYEDIYQEVLPPIASGQILSHVQVWYGNICVAQSDLFSLNDVRSVDDKIFQPPVSEEKDVLGVAVRVILIGLAVFAFVFAVLFLLRRIRKRALINAEKKRSRRYRRNRRRSR